MLDLSKAIHGYTNKPAFVSSFTPLPAVNMELQDADFLRNNFHKLLPPKVGLRGNAKDDGAFQPNALARYYYQDVSSKNGMPAYIAANPTTGVDDLSIAKGVLSSKLGYGLFPLKDLARLKFSKPLRVHWFLQDYRVAFAFKTCDEKIFLTGLAKASCGNFVISKSGYEIVADSEAFRRQWIGLLERQKAETPIELRKERFQMSIEQLQQLSKKQLDRILEKPGGWVHYVVEEKSPLFGRVAKFVSSYLEYCALHQEDTDCYIFSHKILIHGGVVWSNGLRVQIEYPTIEFILDKKLQFPDKPRYVVGF